ncbi:hypothetical protein JHK87_010198 [Glycine soja]|nr:hypothetical protein JHK87_010198 [Glycine soja]
MVEETTPIYNTRALRTLVLPYNQLMQELDMTNVRELEDFLINECLYSKENHHYRVLNGQFTTLFGVISF